MPPIEAERTLGELVLERPGRVQIFEELQLDYCCRGSQTLREAAAQRDLDVQTLVLALEAAERAWEMSSVERDWRQTSFRELSDHIVNVHHAFLRRELPRIGAMIVRVTARHGETLPALEQLEGEFDELREHLLEHMDREEEDLFLVCRTLDEDDGDVAPVLSQQLATHEVAHDTVGKALLRLRELGGDYRAETALCTSHGVMLKSLSGLEQELHQHIHEENNVLFPRLRARLSEAEASASS